MPAPARTAAAHEEEPLPPAGGSRHHIATIARLEAEAKASAATVARLEAQLAASIEAVHMERSRATELHAARLEGGLLAGSALVALAACLLFAVRPRLA